MRIRLCKLSETPETNPEPTLEIYTTGEASLFEEIAENWLNRTGLKVKKVTLKEEDKTRRIEKRNRDCDE